MYSFDFELDDFQKEALGYIEEGKSVVVCAPTGAGKTCIAEFALHRALKEGTRIFYTTPLKALSNQKFHDFGKKYGEEKVGLLTGDISINRDAQVVIMTTEVFRNMLYGTHFGSVRDNLQNVKYVVLDEVHYMNDEQRGTVWEESIIYCPPSVQLIALSATVANSQKLTDWINSVHSRTELVYTDFRPVPLRYFYYDSSRPYDVLPLLTPDGQLNKQIRPERREFGHNRKKTPQRSAAKDVVSILHKKDMLPAIYFTFSRKKCDEQMEKCAHLDLITKEQKHEIQKIVGEYLIENPYLAKNAHLDYLFAGVAAHHAGLLPSWKVLVEKLFKRGLIKVVFATETLAAGINMPARSTVISSISKRTDNGHRILTGSEFLQMSGRAGRRGMDEIGYVTVVGTPFQSPEEVAQLVLAQANPLESRFAPNYSMALNLLQRLSIDEAKELILKSFGYFSSSERLKPLLFQKEQFDFTLKDLSGFRCEHGLTNQDVLDFNKIKNSYVELRKLVKILRKQALSKGNKNAPEVFEYDMKSKDLYKKMISYHCDGCKGYKKHLKDIDVLARFEKKVRALDKEIEHAKDVYWNNFVSHVKVLGELGYMDINYPTEKGLTCAAIRAENELYFSEIILSGVLENLTPAELASVICAINTEDVRSEVREFLPIGVNVKRALGRIKDIRRKIERVQKDNNIETAMYINSYYSPLIELWASGDYNWDDLAGQTSVSEGDIVRCFKRVIDVLRQITIVPNVSSELAQTARDAIIAIHKEPIDLD